MMRVRLFLLILIVACNKTSVDPNEHNPAKLSEKAILNRVAGKWIRITSKGFDQIEIGRSGTASYVTNTTTGSQFYGDLIRL